MKNLTYMIINTHTSNFFTPSSTGIPGPLQKIASSMHLYIWAPEIKETNYALDFDGTNDYVSANGVATELDSSTNLPLSVSAWVYPENVAADEPFTYSTPSRSEPIVNTT